MAVASSVSEWLNQKSGSQNHSALSNSSEYIQTATLYKEFLAVANPRRFARIVNVQIVIAGDDNAAAAVGSVNPPVESTTKRSQFDTSCIVMVEDATSCSEEAVIIWVVGLEQPGLCFKFFYDAQHYNTLRESHGLNVNLNEFASYLRSIFEATRSANESGRQDQAHGSFQSQGSASPMDTWYTLRVKSSRETNHGSHSALLFISSFLTSS